MTDSRFPGRAPTSKRRRAVLLLAVVSAGALCAIWYSGVFWRFGFGEAAVVRAARARARGYSKQISVDPYGLVARVPDGASCKYRVETVCDIGGTSVVWTIVPDAARHKLGEPDLAGGGERASVVGEQIGRVELAGFDGELYSWRETRGPKRGCTFRGRFRELVRGTLHLQIEADHTCDTENVLDVIVTTASRDPSTPGPAKAWPDEETRATHAKLATLFDDLANDAAPYGWAEALGEIAFRQDSGLPRYGEPLRSRDDPSVSALARKRIEHLTRLGTVAALEWARAMLLSLDTWDPPVAEPLWQPVAEKAAQLAERAVKESTALARAIRTLDCRITDRLIAKERDPARALGLARRLSRAGLLELHAANNCAGVLFRHRHIPEIGKLLDDWHDPANIPVPAELDFLDLAEFSQTHLETYPLMRRHALAMLRNHSLGGELTVRNRTYDVVTRHRSFSSFERDGWALPRDGTKIDLRVCDIYATRFAAQFVPYAPVAKRNEQIREAIASLRSEPENRPQ